MNRRIFIQGLIGGATLFAACGKSATAPPSQTPPVVVPPKPKRLLVVTETTGYRHDAIQTSVDTLRALGEETKEWEIARRADTAAEVASAITAAALAGIDAVVFANTTGTLSFTDEGRAAFYAWMRAGGAYIGFHSASDTFHGDAEYLELLGGEFLGHGPQVEVEVFVQDAAHPACGDLPASFRILDEIYEFQRWERSGVHVLLSMHAHPQNGSPGDYPVAWTKRHGAGRAFYTSLGHRLETYADPRFRSHLAGGIRWALGLKPGSDATGNPIV